MTQWERGKLTRREVLAVAVGAAGFAAIGGKTVLGALTPAAKTRMKIGCGTVNFRRRPGLEALERIPAPDMNTSKHRPPALGARTSMW